MSEKITNYVCPACMGSVHFAAEAGNIECDYCGSVYSVEEMEALMADQNAAAEEAAKKVDEWEVIQQEWIGEGMKAYTCPACKAELICDETTAATSCPYCGNPTVVPGQFTGAAKPDYVIPFKLAKEAAVEKLQSHCKGKVLLPKSFTENNHLEEVKGIYVPFWLYDGVAKGAATYEATKKHTKTVGDERITTTEYYSVTRAGEAVFEKIRANIFGIFLTVWNTGRGETFFREKLEQIPLAWQASLEKARAHHDEETVCLETVKLEAVREISAQLEVRA